MLKYSNKPGVKPVELAKQDEIDSGKYMEFMESHLRANYIIDGLGF